MSWYLTASCVLVQLLIPPSRNIKVKQLHWCRWKWKKLFVFSSWEMFSLGPSQQSHPGHPWALAGWGMCPGPHLVPTLNLPWHVPDGWQRPQSPVRGCRKLWNIPEPLLLGKQVGFSVTETEKSSLHWDFITALLFCSPKQKLGVALLTVKHIFHF